MFCLVRKFVCDLTVANFLPLPQNYDRRGQIDIALAKIDEAIEHTPTVIDLYSIKV